MTNPTLVNTWLYSSQPKQEPLVRLFCFPPAGGLRSFFSAWPQYLPDSVEICVVDIRDREQRLSQTGGAEHVSILCAALAEVLRPQLDRPYALFGHCLGSVLAFEVVRLLHASTSLLPIRLYLAGFPAPHAMERLRRRITHWLLLPDHELLTAVLPTSNTLTKALLADLEWIRLTAPLMRRDLALLVEYKSGDVSPLPCPLSLFGGWEDHFVSAEELVPWQYWTTVEHTVHMFAGDHLFPQSKRDALLSILVHDLKKGA